MIASLTGIFGSKTKAQEMVLLLQDAKEVVRQGFYDQELPAVEEFCKKNNLFLIKSKFKILLEDKENNYSNRGLRLAENDPRPGMYFVYISKDESRALLAGYAEMMNRHKELGEILGYPECCINFFIHHFRQDNTNLELLPTNEWTNLSKRGEDCVLLSHFPCRSDCQESIELAQNYFETIKKVDAERAEEMLNILKLK
ncbi:MAG: DUF483 domain-containing protein [Candidatus Woesearchaeota archaeon]